MKTECCRPVVGSAQCTDCPYTVPTYSYPVMQLPPSEQDRLDARRWRKFCGLMAYGQFVVQHFPGGEDDPPNLIDYIADLTRAVDGESNSKAVVGQQSDGGRSTPSQGIEPR